VSKKFSILNFKKNKLFFFIYVLKLNTKVSLTYKIMELASLATEKKLFLPANVSRQNLGLG